MLEAVADQVLLDVVREAVRYQQNLIEGMLSLFPPGCIEWSDVPKWAGGFWLGEKRLEFVKDAEESSVVETDCYPDMMLSD